MTKRIFKLRNVAMIACLAATTLFSACDKDPKDEPNNPNDNGANIVSFAFVGIDGAAAIDKDALTVTAKAKKTVDLTNIVATFTLSTGCTAKVGNTTQVSGQTANNFTNTVNYLVTTSDGNLTNIWKVTITSDEDDGGEEWSLPVNLKVRVQWTETDGTFIENLITKIGENYHCLHLSGTGTYQTLMVYQGDNRWSWWHRPDFDFEWTYGEPFHFYNSWEEVVSRLGGRDFLFKIIPNNVTWTNPVTGTGTFLGRAVNIRDGVFGKYWMDATYNVCLKGEDDNGITYNFEVTEWDETVTGFDDDIELPEDE